jgi:hypothetical protein
MPTETPRVTTEPRKVDGQEPSLETSSEAASQTRLNLRASFQTLNDNPIEFFGRALDQAGAPVVAAEVKGTVLFNTGESSGERHVRTTTDAHGDFRFTGLQGQDLGIEIAKDGYEYHPRNTSFSYTYIEADHKRHIPDPKDPVIFPLWKKQGTEVLVHYQRVWRFPADGTPVKIDLLTGEADAREPDLVVSVSRNPLVIDFGAGGFSWKAVVEVVGGGLVATGERDYYNLAPESGYEARMEHYQ